MPHYVDAIINQYGRPVPGITVYIRISGTATAATLYSDNMVTQMTNPFVTGTDGSIGFWIAAGTYDLDLSGGSPAIQPKTVTIDIGVGGGGSGLTASKTISTGSINGGAATDVVVTWDTPFPNATYKFSVEVLDASGNLRVHHVSAITATTLTVNIVNDDITAHTGTLYALGF